MPPAGTGASTSSRSDPKSSKGGGASSAVSTVEVRKKARPQVAESLMKIKVNNPPAVKDQGAARVVSPKKGMVDRQHDAGKNMHCFMLYELHLQTMIKSNI